jgi:hypothetical protein
MTTEPDIRLRALPSVDSVLKTDAAVPAITRFGRPAAVMAVRQALDAARADLLGGKTQQSEAEAIARTALAKLAADARSKLCPVFNLTGTVLHTCPFRKSHPAWKSHRRVESSHDRERCSRSCLRSQCSPLTSSSRRAGLKPRTCSFAINSA